MRIQLSDERQEMLEMVRQSAKDFAEKNIRPNVMEWDESQHFPVPLFKEMGALGFMGVLVPEEYGGAGLGYQEYITIIDEIAQVCGSIGLSVAAHNSLCTGHILQFGTDEPKERNGYRSWLRLNGSVLGVLLRQERVLMQEVWIPLPYFGRRPLCVEWF